MRISLAGFRELARLLRVAEHQAEDVLSSEPSAKALFSRRGFLLASGAVATGTLFHETMSPEQRQLEQVFDPRKLYLALYDAEGDDANEANYIGYRRVGIARTDYNWEIGNYGFAIEATNGLAISFPTAIGGLARVTSFRLFDGSTRRELFRGSMAPAPVHISSGATFIIVERGLTLQLPDSARVLAHRVFHDRHPGCNES